MAAQAGCWGGPLESVRSGSYLWSSATSNSPRRTDRRRFRNWSGGFSIVGAPGTSNLSLGRDVGFPISTGLGNRLRNHMQRSSDDRRTSRDERLQKLRIIRNQSMVLGGRTVWPDQPQPIYGTCQETTCWLSTDSFARLAGISPQAARKALKRSLENYTWREAQLAVRTVVGRGEASVGYEVSQGEACRRACALTQALNQWRQCSTRETQLRTKRQPSRADGRQLPLSSTIRWVPDREQSLPLRLQPKPAAACGRRIGGSTDTRSVEWLGSRERGRPTQAAAGFWSLGPSMPHSGSQVSPTRH